MPNAIDIKNIPDPGFPTSFDKVRRAYVQGERHAENMFNGVRINEGDDPNLPSGVRHWNDNPYTPTRPAVYYAFIAGFSEKWANLNREIEE
jgi:hypothetical protein